MQKLPEYKKDFRAPYCSYKRESSYFIWFTKINKSKPSGIYQSNEFWFSAGHNVKQIYNLEITDIKKMEKIGESVFRWKVESPKLQQQAKISKEVSKLWMTNRLVSLHGTVTNLDGSSAFRMISISTSKWQKEFTRLCPIFFITELFRCSVTNFES